MHDCGVGDAGWCGTDLGPRAGGQAVAFARHHRAAGVTRFFAVKFFCSEDAFRIEEQTAQLTVRRQPPVIQITTKWA